MAQYCRYCAFCFEGDVAYCSVKDRPLSDERVRRVNHCHDYAESELGDYQTGRTYQPQQQTKQPKPEHDLFDFMK